MTKKIISNNNFSLQAGTVAMLVACAEVEERKLSKMADILLREALKARGYTPESI